MLAQIDIASAAGTTAFQADLYFAGCVVDRHVSRPLLEGMRGEIERAAQVHLAVDDLRETPSPLGTFVLVISE